MGIRFIDRLSGVGDAPAPSVVMPAAAATHRPWIADTLAVGGAALAAAPGRFAARLQTLGLFHGAAAHGAACPDWPAGGDAIARVAASAGTNVVRPCATPR